MLKVELLKTELLEVSAPVPCGVVYIGMCLVTDSHVGQFDLNNYQIVHLLE
jgi:hypothetical protein